MSWKRIFLRRKWDEERARELEAHLQIEMDRNISEGMGDDTARLAARRKLGNATQIREEIFHMNSIGFLETVWQDLRFALRTLRKNRAFTAVAILTLALGIAANTIIFGAVNATLLRPLPYKEPNQLVVVWGTPAQGGSSVNAASNFPTSEPTFLDFKEQNSVFENIATFHGASVTFTGVDNPVRIRTGSVTADFFKVLKVEAALGRTFSPDEDQPGKSSVIVLSHALWRDRYGSNPNIIGQTISLNASPFTVIGILPENFDFSVPGYFHPAQAWTPAVLHRDETQRGNGYLYVIARIKPGLSMQQAQANMETISERLARSYPQTLAGATVKLVPLREQIVGNSRPVLLILLGAVAFVMLIACANVANLQLARASARQKEIAVRAALGAGRGRLIRQMLTESILLGLLGGATGIFLASQASGLVARLGPAGIISSGAGWTAFPVLAFSLALSVVAGVLFGLAPAMQSSPNRLSESLKAGGKTASAGAGGNRLRSILTVSEIALSVVLLIGAGLLVRSFAGLLSVEPGFDTRNVLTMRLSLPAFMYRDAASQISFYKRAIEQTKRLPGVRAAGAIDDLPLTSDRDSNPISTEKQTDVPVNQLPVTQVRSVTPEYFRAMNIPLDAGRFFSETDSATSPQVVIINQCLARSLFPNTDPVGQRVKLGAAVSTLPWLTIVGVVGDVRDLGLDAKAGLEAYQPFEQSVQPYMNLVVRTASDPATLAGPVRDGIRQLDKGLPLVAAQPMESVLDESISQRRFNMVVLAIFAGLALVLAAVGVYGVISYSVTRRTQELGIRMALGARPLDVLGLVVGQGLRLALFGAALGLTAAFLLMQVLRDLLFGVTATDPVTYAGVSLVLIAVAVMACYLPARRAAAVSPIVALRHE